MQKTPGKGTLEPRRQVQTRRARRRVCTRLVLERSWQLHQRQRIAAGLVQNLPAGGRGEPGRARVEDLRGVSLVERRKSHLLQASFEQSSAFALPGREKHDN